MVSGVTLSGMSGVVLWYDGFEVWYLVLHCSMTGLSLVHVSDIICCCVMVSGVSLWRDRMSLAVSGGLDPYRYQATIDYSTDQSPLTRNVRDIYITYIYIYLYYYLWGRFSATIKPILLGILQMYLTD